MAKLRHEVTDLSEKLLRIDGLTEELQYEESLLAKRSTSDGQADAKPLVWKNPGGGVMSTEKNPEGQPAESIGQRMEADLRSMSGIELKAVSAWRSVTEKKQAFRHEVIEAEARAGRSWETVETNRGAWYTPDLIALGVLAVFGGFILSAHEVRDRIRWSIRALASRPVILIVALSLPISIATGASAGAADDLTNLEPGDKSIGSPDREADELTRVVATTCSIGSPRKHKPTLPPNSGSLSDFEKSRSENTTLLLAANPTQDSLTDRTEAAVQERFRAIRVSARIASRAASEAQQINQELVDDPKLDNDAKKLKDFISGSRDTGGRDARLRIGACVILILAAVVPMMSIRSRGLRSKKEQRLICPQCLLNSLKPGDAPIDERHPRSRLFTCDSCDYEMREHYLEQNRLCFPTVGRRGSGKTHWMMMVYEMVKNANLPVASTIKKIPSREDARFDQLLRDLLRGNQGPQATVYSLPYPLTFHVHDNDPLGPNKTMTNLFDFSGELQDRTIDFDEFRRRALLCEGFTFFLDPTEDIEDQIQGLARFAEEMHAIRGLPSERPIDMPISVCVTKMDLLVTDNSMGSQAIPFIASLRDTIGLDVNLSLIQKRSQLCAQVLPLMFPGWNVERALKENFGGRYMFFPMSSVGLEKAELGIKDLSGRTIAPFGMIEPLLWLLHMHGYCVLH